MAVADEVAALREEVRELREEVARLAARPVVETGVHPAWGWAQEWATRPGTVPVEASVFYPR